MNASSSSPPTCAVPTPPADASVDAVLGRLNQALTGDVEGQAEEHANRQKIGALTERLWRDAVSADGSHSSELLGMLRKGLQQIEAEAMLPELPVLTPLSELASIPRTGDPGELLRHRFLCRGGALLIVGPTGFGKSSLIMQAAIMWALCKPLFGIVPGRPLRSWIIQAENDAGDLAEARDGVMKGMIDEKLGTPEQLQAALGMVSVVKVDSVTGATFPPWLDRMLTAAGDNKPDLVFIDPLLAYIGGDVSKQEVASAFLRGGLNPVLHRHNIGLAIVHHTGKPAKDRGHELNGDFAYNGTGSSELANWPRAILCVQAVPGSDHVYRLRAAKRGRRLGWTDAGGGLVLSKFIAHSKVPGQIYWVTPDAADIPAEAAELVKSGPRAKSTKQLADQALAIMHQSGKYEMPLQTFKAEIGAKLGIGRDLLNDVIKLLLDGGRLVKHHARTADGACAIICIPGATSAPNKAQGGQSPSSG